MRIQDKVIVITGGASGLGWAAARYLLEEKGARVAIFDLNVEAGERAVADLGPERALFVQTDVSNEASVQNAVNAVMARFGAIHVCIDCAALLGPCSVLGRNGKATPLAKFAQTIAVNVNGVFNVMSKCVEQMSKNEAEAGEERGVVINISSAAAYEGQIGQCAYSASKAALLGLNLPAARELGAIGVRVNAIAPGGAYAAGGGAQAPGRCTRICPLLCLCHRERLPQRRNHPPRRSFTLAGEIRIDSLCH
jgi:NAD(P)-dependent dehydrogenase (short-subunit alcohol dehydrogenase family)